MGLTHTIVHEDPNSDRIYLVAPVTPIEPSSAEIEEYAYGASIVKESAAGAPNQFIKWYSGHYVEADNPNGNGAMWTAKEIAIKGLTPRFMPVTVMHQPETAVGLIADVQLRTPEKDGVPRPKLDTALALWAHRFPEVIEEAALNYERGTLMQSMECFAPAYDCGVCGMGFLKLPHGAEQANWCAHLKGEEGSTAVRILRATTFTGTGLIFGTRGSAGADPLAHLEDFKQEVAEFHQRGAAVNKPTGTKRSSRNMDITIDKAEYDALQARPTAEQVETARAEAQRAVAAQESSDAENVKLRKDLEDQGAELTAMREVASQATLRDERMGKLGDKFVAALGETTASRLRKQAGEMQDPEWSERIEELASLVKVDADAKTDPTAPVVTPPAGGGTPAPGSGTPVFNAEEVAALKLRGGDIPTAPAKLTSGIFEGLVSRTKSTPAAK